MKLTLKIAAAIILLLLLSVYGYLQFRESRSYQQQVAKNASVVYKLNVDGLLQTMAADFAGNPGYYLKDNEKGNGRPDFSLPANIFVYSLETMAPTTLFSSIALSDTIGLYAYLKQVLKVKDFTFIASKDIMNGSNATGRTIGTSRDHKLTVVYDAKVLAIAYSFKKELVVEELNNLIDHKNRMNPAAPLMLALKKAKGHLSWTAVGYSGQVNFKDGEAEMEGSFPTEYFDIPDHPRVSVKFANNALIKIWLNGGFKKLQLSKPAVSKPEAKLKALEMLNLISLNGIQLSSDSLLKSYLGFAAFEMGPGITQTDSVIAYEYNDDFEKIAKVQLQKVTVPYLKLSIAAKAGDLLNYLSTNQVISNPHKISGEGEDNENRLNKELFPLYQVFSSHKNNVWQLSTQKNDAIKFVSLPNSNFFSASLDLNGIKKQQLFPLLNNWLKPFTHLRIEAAKLDSGAAKLSGKLKFQEQDVNAFFQMLR
ncbi:hypothetical protein QG516_01465 [Pedobacter gandavensis]|uniref:hypothetical protein n=1 Tax=Pedobacter gandavensis TaxID=2679963 RepID=UPI00247B21BC|nr:hypothetical protein [Pedobacter gandavensis]WGQ10320.1 hypothetical protein QG516_01465 [Pedobacter gandavensis]